MDAYFCKYFKNSNAISYQIQFDKLEKEFPNGIKRETLLKVSFIFNISPDNMGRLYGVKLEYDKRNSIVSIFVIDPKPLPLASGNKKYPHMYSQKEQRLCLYYPKAKEFDSRRMCWLNTIVNWTKEWFYFYEIWVITGDWLGKEIKHNEDDAEFN